MAQSEWNSWLTNNWKFIAVAVLATTVTAGVIYSVSSKTHATSIPKKKRKKSKASKEKDTEDVAKKEISLDNLEEITALSPEEKNALAQKAKAEGNKLYTEKKFESAIEKYTKAIEIAPSAVFYSNRAACHSNLQNYEEVVKDCNEALSLDSKYIKALNRRAQAYEKLQNLKSALNDYTVICVLEGFKNEASMAAPDRILKQIAAERTKEIIRDKVAKMPSETFISAYMDSFRVKPTDVDLLADLNTEAKSSVLMKSAAEEILKRNWSTAFDLCDKSIKIGEFDDPSTQSKALNLRGTFYFLMGKIEDAVKDIEQALEIEPDNINTIIKRATLFMENAEIEKAIQQFDRAEKIAPNHPDLFYHRGQVRFLTGDFQGAVQDYITSLENEKPGEQSVYVHIQTGVAKYKQGDIGGAEKKFKEAKRLFPDSAEVFNYHGEILMDKQAWSEALKSFDKSIEMDPRSPLPYINKAILYLQWKQDTVKAEQECRKALEKDPLCDIAYTQLAQLLCHQNKVDEALKIYEKAIEITRTEAEIMNVVSCQEAAMAQQYVGIHYPEAMKSIGH